VQKTEYGTVYGSEESAELPGPESTVVLLLVHPVGRQCCHQEHYEHYWTLW